MNIQSINSINTTQKTNFKGLKVDGFVTPQLHGFFEKTIPQSLNEQLSHLIEKNVLSSETLNKVIKPLKANGHLHYDVLMNTKELNQFNREAASGKANKIYKVAAKIISGAKTLSKFDQNELEQTTNYINAIKKTDSLWLGNFAERNKAILDCRNYFFKKWVN